MTGRDDYEARRAARIERTRARAEKARAASAAASDAAHNTLKWIPAGQPILVGHHSERRHRRDLARAEANLHKSVELDSEAQALERRADAAESSTAISSDDPKALDKLRAELASSEAFRERWKAINKALRKRDVQALKHLNLTADERRVLEHSSFDASFTVRNAGAEIRRLKQRISELEAQQARGPRQPEQYGDIEISEGDNRVRIRFPDKPGPEMRARLKSEGFRFARSVDAWQRHASDRAWWLAQKIAKGAS